MRSIEEIKGRCIIEDGDDGKSHWLWQGAMRTRRGHNTRTPCVWAPDYTHDPAGVMRTQSVPRAVVHISSRKPIPDGKFPFRICSHDRCVNPACFTKLLTMTQWGHYAAKHGLLLERNDYTASNMKTWDTRGRKLDRRAATQIATSSKTGRELQLEHGIVGNYANAIKRGDRRRPEVRLALGVFAGLGARHV